MELPETSLLVTFESIARNASFRGAADELGLTPSAISHRLKTLERSIGRALITRTTRHVALTPAGEVLLPAARGAINLLTDAQTQLKEPTPEIVTIVTTDSVAGCWLIDRLPTATAEVDDTEVRILTVAAGVPFDPLEADLAIAYGPPNHWPAGDAILVAPETISPACTPTIAAQVGSLVDLWKYPLLEDSNLFLSWEAFAAHVGANPTQLIQPQATYSHSHLALRAAAAGHGIALAGTPLVNDAIARGELVHPLPDHAVTSPHAYHLVTSHLRRSPSTPQVRLAIAKALLEPDSPNPVGDG